MARKLKGVSGPMSVSCECLDYISEAKGLECWVLGPRCAVALGRDGSLPEGCRRAQRWRSLCGLGGRPNLYGGGPQRCHVIRPVRKCRPGPQHRNPPQNLPREGLRRCFPLSEDNPHNCRPLRLCCHRIRPLLNLCMDVHRCKRHVHRL
jgi:hypothetical protein